MITVRGLQKTFGPVRAVAGVDLDVDQGQILVLLGQNGAGKSTTLRCLGGILHPEAGEISFGNLKLPEDLPAVRSRLGVVPDQARLYGRTTAFEYLDHFGRLYGVSDTVRGPRIRALLERFELAGRDDQVLWSYSRGMMQKVALIRATLHEPSWIFCDEPTAGLDPIAAADMRSYLREQAARGAALIVTTHILPEAELMADRIAVMRLGRVMAAGTLQELQRQAEPLRSFEAVLASGETVRYSQPWEAGPAEMAAEAARLQAQLAGEGRPYYRLQEVPVSLETVYLRAMTAEPPEALPPVAATTAAQGILPSQLVRSLREQPGRLRYLLPFYVSSWWRRGELPWVMWLNGFVLLLVGGASLFGTLPGGIGGIGKIAGASALQAGLLLPLFFMSFALMESIKTSIGIWWEKAQQSLEVLLYTPLDDASIIWIEVLPGAVVSAVWVTFWMAAACALLSFFGRPAPWDLLPAFTLIGALTAYWAAMGRMLGFMLFPREGAAGGAWSFLLSPVSAAVADLPLAAFLFRSPLAPLSLLLPLAACLALSVLCAASFDRERLMDSGLTRVRTERRRWLPLALLRRHATAIGIAVLLAAIPAGIASVAASSAHLHSWPQVKAAISGQPIPASADPCPGCAQAPRHGASGVTVAAAAMAGVTGGLALALVLLGVNFAAFFLLGVPELLILLAGAVLWGLQAGFGPAAPLAGWLGVGGGIALLALALNTAAALPIYRALVFGAGTRVERLRLAWAEYFQLYRGLVLPCCLAFGLAVLGLLVFG